MVKGFLILLIYPADVVTCGFCLGMCCAATHIWLFDTDCDVG
jgi:hypothetical protein